MNQQRGEFTLSCDPSLQQPERIHAFLCGSYWAEGVPLETIKRAIGGSLCFGVFAAGKQVALARVVTDRATFAYLCDVYVLEEYRGRGFATWMLDAIDAHPDLQGLRRFMLATRDAHGLYARRGFLPLARPEAFMERHRPDIYKKTAS